MFDNKWNDNIYINHQQVNKYPYDWVISKVNRHFSNVKKNTNDNSAIELGSGTGNNLKFLSEFGFNNVIGIEGSIIANDIAKKFLSKEKNVSVFSYDFSNLHFNNDEFNLCLDRGSITHNKLTDIKKTLNEVYRVLKPGGYFFSSMFSKKHYQHSIAQKFDDYYLSFNDIMNVNEGVVAYFFNDLEIKNIFSKFKILEIIHSQNTDLENKNLSTAMWNIVARKI